MIGMLSAFAFHFTKVLVVSRSHRQAREIIKTMKFFHFLLGSQGEPHYTNDEIRFGNHSRIASMPCKEETVRGFAGVDLLIIDEAARVPDDLYKALRPMVAVSKGRIFCLSTPHGKRGFFWDAWANGGDDWQRIEVPATQIPRITPEFLEQEKRALGEAWFRQEYCCSFEAMEGLVYPDFARCVSETPPTTGPHPDRGGKVGGIDFGYRNPFAAIWGFVDRDDVLWLTGEHYARQQPLSVHAQNLPKDVMWYADPSGANDIAELRYAGFLMRKGNNAIRNGIAAINARLNAGTLRVVKGACPNLLKEAGLYRYQSEGEEPVDDHNHALAALRYLVSAIDRHCMVLGGKRLVRPDSPPAKPKNKEDDERYWIPIEDWHSFRRSWAG
jgi:hypothetical protein